MWSSVHKQFCTLTTQCTVRNHRAEERKHRQNQHSGRWVWHSSQAFYLLLLFRENLN